MEALWKRRGAGYASGTDDERRSEGTVRDPNGDRDAPARPRPERPNYVHGVYSSRRELPPEALALVEDLMSLSHVVPADRLAAEEVARLVYLIGRVDASLEVRVFPTRAGSRWRSR